MRELVRVLALALSVVACSATPAEAAAIESWFSITFHGRRVGFVRASESMTRLDGRPAVRVERSSIIEVRRREERIRMEQSLEAWFGPDGTPLRYRVTRNEGAEVRRGEGRKEGDRFVVRQDIGGRSSTRSFDLKPGDHLAASIEWLHLRTLEPGRVVRGRALDEAEGDLQPFTLTVGPAITGREGSVHRVEETLGEPGRALESVLEVSAKEGLLRTELMGTGIVMTRVPKEDALKLEESFDIFSASMFPVKAHLPDRERLDGLTVTLAREVGAPPKVLADATQAVEKVGESKVRVRTKRAPAPKKSAKRPIGDPALARWLAATDYEDLRDARLVAASRREVGDAQDVWTAARRINAFVHRHLEQKTLAKAFASATEALDERAGDCTEHAVLFSALAKIAGIPTKLVTGLVYVGGARPAFGYHEWVEVWIGDRWVPMDPTFGQDVADPTHIKFSEGLSDPTGLRDAGVAAAGLIGDVSIVIEGSNPAASR